MKRAERRHHVRRLKNKWRKIVDAWHHAPRNWTQQDRQRYIGKRVNHPRHYCQICKIGVKYVRCHDKWDTTEWD